MSVLISGELRRQMSRKPLTDTSFRARPREAGYGARLAHLSPNRRVLNPRVSRGPDKPAMPVNSWFGLKSGQVTQGQ